MKTKQVKSILWLVLMGGTLTLAAQDSVKEYVDKAGNDKIKKAVVVEQKPVTAAGFEDGHGRNPVLVSRDQLPKKIAMATFFIYDLGSTKVTSSGSTANITYTWVSPAGGNALANTIHVNSIDALKAAVQKNGAQLLTPEEYLDSDDKRKFYYETFTPNVSKMGKFLGDLETKHVDINVAADYYRPLDISASWDHLRSESLGSDLTKALGVDGVLSISVEIQSDNKNVNMHGIKMALHGPNPIPKEDKNYVAQKMGNGWYAGNIYSSAYFFFPKPISVGQYDKKKMEGQKKKVTTLEMNFEGVGNIMQIMIDEMYASMNESIEKAAPRYGKKK